MRPNATALIVAIAVVVAACGGDDAASPSPATQSPAAAATTSGVDASAVVDAAEETAATDDGTGGAVEFAKSAKHSSSDDPEATFGLVSGRYRFAWDTPSENPCSRIEVAVTQVDGEFQYAKSSTAARFNTTVNDLPQGIYKLEQLDPECSEWELRIDWMTN